MTAAAAHMTQFAFHTVGGDSERERQVSVGASSDGRAARSTIKGPIRSSETESIV